jgi:hypothetical protein
MITTSNQLFEALKLIKKLIEQEESDIDVSVLVCGDGSINIL